MNETDDELLERFARSMSAIEREVPQASAWRAPDSANRRAPAGARDDRVAPARPAIAVHDGLPHVARRRTTRLGGLAPALAALALLVALALGVSLLPGTVPTTPSGSLPPNSPTAVPTVHALSAAELGALLAASDGAAAGRVVVADLSLRQVASYSCLPLRPPASADACLADWQIDGLAQVIVTGVEGPLDRSGLYALRIRSATRLDLLGTVTPGPSGFAWTVDQALGGRWSLAVVDGWLGAIMGTLPCPPVPATSDPPTAARLCGHVEWLSTTDAAQDWQRMSDTEMAVAAGAYRSFAPDPATADAPQPPSIHGTWLVEAAPHSCPAGETRADVCNTLTVVARLAPVEPVAPGPSAMPWPSGSPAQASGTATLHLSIVIDPRPQPSGLMVGPGLGRLANITWARLTASNGAVAARWQPGVDPDPTVPAGTYELEAWGVSRDGWAEGGTSWDQFGDRPIGMVTLTAGQTSIALHVTAGWTRPFSVGPSGSMSLSPAYGPSTSPMSGLQQTPDGVVGLVIDTLHAEERLAGRIAAPIAVSSVAPMTAAEALQTVPELATVSLAQAWPARLWVVRAQGTFATGGTIATSGYLVFSDTDGSLLGIGATGSPPSLGPQVSPFPLTLVLQGRTVTIDSAASCDSLGGSAWYLQFCRALASGADWRSILPMTSQRQLAQLPELVARVIRAYEADDAAVCTDPIALRLRSPNAAAPDPNATATPVPFAVACQATVARIHAAGSTTVSDPTTTNNADPLRVVFPAGGT